MSTTRALLPRPACYALHKVASVVFAVIVVIVIVATAIAAAVTAVAAAVTAAVAAVVNRQLHLIVSTVDCLLLSTALRRWPDRLPSPCGHHPGGG